MMHTVDANPSEIGHHQVFAYSDGYQAMLGNVKKVSIRMDPMVTILMDAKFNALIKLLEDLLSMCGARQ